MSLSVSRRRRGFGESSRTSVCSKYISSSVYMRHPKGEGDGVCVCSAVFTDEAPSDDQNHGGLELG